MRALRMKRSSPHLLACQRNVPLTHGRKSLHLDGWVSKPEYYSGHACLLYLRPRSLSSQPPQMPSYLPQHLDDDGSYSGSSSISTWLQGHPELPHQYIREDETATAPRKPRKRKQALGQGNTTSSIKYPKLAELPSCRMNEASNRKQSHSEDESPSKSVRRDRNTRASVRRQLRPADATNQSQTPTARPTRLPQNLTFPSREDDLEATPKPASNISTTRIDTTLDRLPTPMFPPLGHNQREDNRSAVTSSTRSSEVSEDSDLTSASRGKRREGSPKRPTRMADFLLSNTPVVIKDFGTPGFPIPTDVKPLYKDLAFIAAGRHVIPLAIQSIAAKELLEETFPENFLSQVMQQEQGEQKLTGGLGYQDFWTQVLKVEGSATACFNAKLPEASWNSEVHSTVLNLALVGPWKAKGIWYRDVTPAKITDKALLPKYAKGDSMQSKMVDYVLALNPDSDGDLQHRIVARLIADQMKANMKAEQRSSINHTDAEYLSFSPIAVSMQTKRGAIDEDNMRVQISLWVSAHFARLRQLNSKVELPSLPILVMLGHKWKLMIAQVKNNSKIVILGDKDLGDTCSVKGVFQIIAVVRRLADWVHDDYLPWFESSILAGL